MTNTESWRSAWRQPCVEREQARSLRGSPDLGLRHHLRAGPDKLSVRPIDETIYDHGRPVRRVWSRPEHRRCKGARHFACAENSPTRSEMVAAEIAGCKPACVDGRSKRHIGRSTPYAARA